MIAITTQLFDCKLHSIDLVTSLLPGSGTAGYDYPHVFCYFDGWKGEPYERIGYCEEWEFDGITHYREILNYKDVFKESRRHGLKVF